MENDVVRGLIVVFRRFVIFSRAGEPDYKYGGMPENVWESRKA
jgi:hypothetical protein